MRFIPEARIEARAAEIWQRHGLTPGFDVERLLDELDLGLVWEQVADETGSMVLGQLIPGQRIVVLNERHIGQLEEKGGRLRRYTIGHEIGHWEFHADDVRAGMLSLLDGDRIWCRTGSPDPAERQAEMFSASLLMPRNELLAALPQHPWRGWPQVYRLADAFLVNVTPMKIRLEKLGWMHLDDPAHRYRVPSPFPASGHCSRHDMPGITPNHPRLSWPAMPGPAQHRCTHSARPQIDRRGLGLLEVAQFHRGLVEAVSEGDISQFRVELRRHYLWGFPSQDGPASSPPDRAGGM